MESKDKFGRTNVFGVGYVAEVSGHSAVRTYDGAVPKRTFCILTGRQSVNGRHNLDVHVGACYAQFRELYEKSELLKAGTKIAFAGVEHTFGKNGREIHIEYLEILGNGLTAINETPESKDEYMF